MSESRTTTVLIAALGGEGGGVLAGWLVDAAGRAGHWVQQTSIPGVAQRTGATTYYIEIMERAEGDDRQPVMGLTASPGNVDVMVASELLEAGRALENAEAWMLLQQEKRRSRCRTCLLEDCYDRSGDTYFRYEVASRTHHRKQHPQNCYDRKQSTS